MTNELALVRTWIALAGLSDDALLCAAAVALAAWATVAAERLGLETARDMLTDIAIDVTERAMGAQG